MAIRIRTIKNKQANGGFSYIALCAAKSKPVPGDLYLNDGIHSALTDKFTNDFESEGLIISKSGTEKT